jgi:hypothetical protein
MKRTFYIVLNIRTAGGFESYGRFFLGNDREFAYRLFSKLEGNTAVAEKDVIHMDLMEASEGLPLNIRMKSCRIEELALNCKIITKEIFKFLNLGDQMV